MGKGKSTQPFSQLSRKQTHTKMNSMTLVLLAVVACIGAAVADYGYGSYGGYGASMGGFVPVTTGTGTDSSLLWLIGFLFLFMMLFNNNIFNTTSGSSATPITVIQG